MAATADKVGAELAAWLGSILPDIPVLMQPLGSRARQSGIDLRLLRASPRPGPRDVDPTLVADLDFLATVQLEDAADEQRAIGELVFAVMARWDLEVLAGEDAAAICGALGVPPAPGFVARATLTREREVRPVPRVRAPLVVRAADLAAIAGVVVGPGDVPVAGATVSVVGLDRFARTDRDGRFSIAAAPARGDVRLIARARGREVEAVAAAGAPVTLRLPLEV